MPKNNKKFWERKLVANKARDRLVGRTLKASGWRVLRVWEHELIPNRERHLLARVLRALSK